MNPVYDSMEYDRFAIQSRTRPSDDWLYVEDDSGDVATFYDREDANNHIEEYIDVAPFPVYTQIVPWRQDLICPFCKDTDFDLVGLKTHLFRYCPAYDNMPVR